MRRESTPKENPSLGVAYTSPWRVTKVTPLANYSLEVEFVDGTCGIVEMFYLIMSDKAGVFSKLKSTEVFNQVYLEHGAVTWPGEVDLAPDAMYDEILQHGKWVLKPPLKYENQDL